jgi:hypothetical protein
MLLPQKPHFSVGESWGQKLQSTPDYRNKAQMGSLDVCTQCKKMGLLKKYVQGVHYCTLH